MSEDDEEEDEDFDEDFDEGDFDRGDDDDDEYGSGDTVPADEGDSCRICGNGQSWSTNLILYCDGCDMPVHQLCYDVSTVPEGDWFCRNCHRERNLSTDHPQPRATLLL